AGRTTTEVDARRSGRPTVQRMFVDTQTGLLLGRRVFDENGRPLRSLEFTSITIGPAAGTVDHPRVRAKEAPELREIPAGCRAPETAGGGYTLVAKARLAGGGVQLTYSDGLFTASIYEQRGELDWDGLAPGAEDTAIAGHDARRWTEAGVDVIVWE